MAVRHKFQSDGAQPANPGDVGGVHWNEVHNAPPGVITLIGQIETMTNMSAGLVEVDSFRRRSWIDLTYVEEVRTMVCVHTAGSAAAVIRVQYTLPAVEAWTEFGPLADVNVPINTIGTHKSIWVPIPVEAKTDLIIRAVSEAGSGSADPVITIVNFQFR